MIIDSQIDAVVPSWEDSDFAKTFEGQVMVQLTKSIKSKHFIEAVLLSWTTIEQVLLPRLIKFITENLKLKLPDDIQKMNLQSTNILYYALSHDKDLFDRLEKGRDYRNKIIHKIYKESSMSEVEKNAKEATIYIIETQQQIIKRFEGKILIPSLNLYRNGWNDALTKVIELIYKKP